MLLLARVEGSLSFDDGVPCSAEQVARLAIHDASHGDNRRIQLRLPEGSAEAHLEMPAVLAVAALRNLLDNALRHTPDNAPVIVTLQLDDDQACFEVRDQGPGIAPQDLQFLTQRFWRNSQSTGCGLGLAIVQAIVQRCGCTLQFETQADGLRVRLSMPRRAVVAE
ncbi:Phosphate regulon sensor protein PhoR [compost metagenome]